MITETFLPLSLAFIMFSMGLALVPGDFKRVVTEPVAMGVGLVSQMVLLPVLAFILVTALETSPMVAVGIMILAACPGGITSNLLTHLARGDTALSISMTAVTSVAGVITVPLIVNFALGWFAVGPGAADLPVGRMVWGVFAISTLPVIAGMTLRHFLPAWTTWVEPKARGVSTALFAIIVVGAFTSQWGDMSRLFQAAGPAALALNLGTMALAFFGAGAMRLRRRRRIAITLECGLQNAALAIFVATSLLGEPALMTPALIYALIMNVSAFAFILAAAYGPERLFGYR